MTTNYNNWNSTDDMTEDTEHTAEELDTTPDEVVTGDDATDTDDHKDTDHEYNSDNDSAGSARKGKKRRATNNRPIIRKAVKKALDVMEADASTLTVVAHLTSTEKDDTEGLVAAILTSNRRTLLQPVNDIREARGTSEFELGILIHSFGRERGRDMWGLLDVLGRTDGESLPNNELKAALQIAQVITSMTDEDMARLDSADTLMEK